MNMKEFLLAVMALLLGAVVLLSPAACTMRRHQIIADAIKDGADPVAAKCAIEGDNSREPVCIIYAARITERGKE